jgi:hypothetical protein
VILRILGLVSGAFAFAATLVGWNVAGSIGLAKLGLLDSPTLALVFVISLVPSVFAFRGIHDWVVLRWSNETDPFVYGEWKMPRFRHIV